VWNTEDEQINNRLFNPEISSDIIEKIKNNFLSNELQPVIWHSFMKFCKKRKQTIIFSF